jgi:hypothetical protein
MSLRKSPRRTQAMLAANRRNSRKSTGPRTFEGKWHSSENAVRHYRRTQFASCIPIENRESRAFEDFLFRLREAIIPADNVKGTETILLKAAEVWRVKRSFDRWIETRTEEDWLILAAGAVPRPRSWRLKLRRPGLSVPDWVVTASVCLRWGRGPGETPGQSGRRSRRSAAEDDDKEQPRMHTIVSVHTTGPRDVARASSPCCSRPGWPCHEQGQTTEPELERTKPESYSSQNSSKNMSVPAHWDPDYAAAYALAERIVGWFMGWGKRTKPESARNQEACKNVSVTGSRWSVVGAWTTWYVAWWGLVRGQLLGRGHKLQVGPNADHRKPNTEKQTKPECFTKGGACKNMSKTGDWLGTWASLLLKRGRSAGAAD